MPKAKNLKYCRTKANLTQQAFADKIGVSKATINSWENKKRAIPAPNAKRIAEYFGVNYHDFCDVDLEQGDTNLILTSQETEGILMFRALGQVEKDIIRHAIKELYNNRSGGK